MTVRVINQLGPKAIMMGYVARSTVDLADIWRPGLEQLAGASRETALVMRRIGDAAVCVDRVECDHPVRLSFDVGKAMPLHTGAGAKVPHEYRSLFRGHAALLRSHRGSDIGSHALAKSLARALRAPLLVTSTTRLLVECNRSSITSPPWCGPPSVTIKPLRRC